MQQKWREKTQLQLRFPLACNFDSSKKSTEIGTFTLRQFWHDTAKHKHLQVTTCGVYLLHWQRVLMSSKLRQITAQNESAQECRKRKVERDSNLAAKIPTHD
uniref:(northern house mosquito) hypothetical protein n=1 Tax=Culex pipiens TaxID=7175 RepID=A0A8D8G9R8_CULPI